ncbi:MAG TPA: efflux RND transporter periplasmic adaptor subunit [Vicinamibacterales bacterium]|nr:efflux RND transporter periplasmic adaptor subunit [Vicinamibacterales bacterium]
MTARLVFLLGGLAAAAACGGSERPEAAATRAVELGPESVAAARIATIESGPIVSGAIAPARSATVRAEVGGSVVAISVDEGEPVRRGQIVARIEARDLEEAHRSAEVAVRAAEQQLAIARSEAARTQALVEGGALAERDLELARNQVAAAESQLAAARAKLAAATQQLADTVVRAPIDGIVSVRSASAGDVVSPGTALVTIIDPSSLRLEAAVPSERVGEIRPGVPVEFEVRGYPGRTFLGRIARLSPAADPATRQVKILVEIPNVDRRLIAGLYAEGRIKTTVRQALVVPASAVDETSAKPAVTRIAGGRAERVEVQLGLRDPEREVVEILSGLRPGDQVLVGAARALTPGTPVAVRQVAAR